MVIDDLHFESISIAPFEAEPPLVIDPDAVLTRPVASQPFEPVAGKDGQIAEFDRGIQFTELSPSDPLDCTEPFVSKPEMEPLGIFIPERPYHAPMS